MVDLTISIATENNERLLAECLDSIYKSIKNISLEIYIIDNSPNDRTKEMLAGKFPDVNVVSPLAVNNFASNHNQILKIASGKNVVILNDDTIIKVGAFDKMHRYLIEHPEAGIAGPRIINTDGSYQHSAFKFPNLIDFSWNALFYRINSTKAPALYSGIEKVACAREADWLLGACLMLPKSVIDKVGLFDEGFAPAYSEDTDLCKRIKDAGYRIVYYPEAEIIHYGGRTTRRQKPLMNKVLAKNRIKFFRKHRGVIYSFCARCILFCANLLDGIVRILKS